MNDEGPDRLPVGALVCPTAAARAPSVERTNAAPNPVREELPRAACDVPPEGALTRSTPA